MARSVIVVLAMLGMAASAPPCASNQYQNASGVCNNCTLLPCNFGLVRECGDAVSAASSETFDRICATSCAVRSAECLYGDCVTTDICTCRLGLACAQGADCGQVSTGLYSYNVSRASFSRAACPGCACVADPRIVVASAPPTGGCGANCTFCVRGACLACKSPLLLQNGTCVSSCSSDFYKLSASVCEKCTTEAMQPCPFGVQRSCRTINVGTGLQLDRTCVDGCTYRKASAGNKGTICACQPKSVPSCAGGPAGCERDFGFGGDANANVKGYWFDRTACLNCSCSDPCPVSSFPESSAVAFTCRCPISSNWTCPSNRCSSGTITGGVSIIFFPPTCDLCQCVGPVCPANSFLTRAASCACPSGYACTGATCVGAGKSVQNFTLPCLDCQCVPPAGVAGCGGGSAVNPAGECLCPFDKPCQTPAFNRSRPWCQQRVTDMNTTESYFDAAICPGCTCAAVTTTTTTTTTPTTTTTTTTTTTASPMTESPTSRSFNNSDESTDSGNSAVVGIAAGAGAGGLILVIVVVFFGVRAYRGRDMNKLPVGRQVEYVNPVYTGSLSVRRSTINRDSASGSVKSTTASSPLGPKSAWVVPPGERKSEAFDGFGGGDAAAGYGPTPVMSSADVAALASASTS